MTALTLPHIHHKVSIRADQDVVYGAITTKAGLEAWLTTEASIGGSVGGAVHFRWKNYGPDLINVEDGGDVVEWDPPRVFAFRWQPGRSTTTVRFELASRGSETIVELIESGHAECQEDLDALVDCAAGWGEALTRLKFFVEHSIRT